MTCFPCEIDFFSLFRNPEKRSRGYLVAPWVFSKGCLWVKDKWNLAECLKEIRKEFAVASWSSNMRSKRAGLRDSRCSLVRHVLFQSISLPKLWSHRNLSCNQLLSFNFFWQKHLTRWPDLVLPCALKKVRLLRKFMLELLGFTLLYNVTLLFDFLYTFDCHSRKYYFKRFEQCE